MSAQAWGKVCRILLQWAHMSQDMFQSFLLNSKAHCLLDLWEQDACQMCSWWYLHCTDSHQSNTNSHPIWAWACVRASANSPTGMMPLLCHCCNPSIIAFVIAWSICWSHNHCCGLPRNTELCGSYLLVVPDIMGKQCWIWTATILCFSHV